MSTLKKLTSEDGIDVYNMLKGIGAVENSFTNPVQDMNFTEYKMWLVQQEKWDKGEMLPDGYVPQSIFWLYDNDVPVGVGKIRHSLTDQSRIVGGNIGYAISRKYRKKGYGEELLKLLLIEAREMGLEEIILTVDKGNEGSRSICIANGGQVFNVTSERFYFRF